MHCSWPSHSHSISLSPSLTMLSLSLSLELFLAIPFHWKKKKCRWPSHSHSVYLCIYISSSMDIISLSLSITLSSTLHPFKEEGGRKRWSEREAEHGHADVNPLSLWLSTFPTPLKRRRAGGHHILTPCPSLSFWLCFLLLSIPP